MVTFSWGLSPNSLALSSFKLLVSSGSIFTPSSVPFSLKLSSKFYVIKHKYLYKSKLSGNNGFLFCQIATIN
jgi:hypothetical protein